MKILIFLLFSSVLALACGVFVPPRPGHRKHHLLGEKECTYGPTYWCENLKNSANCHATKHCIQTVWVHKQLPPDTSSICQTCKDMVKQARDQLESNETQELIKEVFEGSCALLRIKPIVKECDQIADEYIPELIDTLASQMNPQVVCSVAGLCNNPKVHQLLAEAGEQISVKPSQVTVRNKCDDCNTVMDIAVNKFNGMSRNDALEWFLMVCGKMSSFSDACSNAVITHFSDIYSYLKQNLNAGDICLLSGECSTNFHKHAIEITPMSKIGYVPVDSQKDDLPCQLCEQLVKHLQDVLIANTTEDELEKVLEGICGQTGVYKKECLNLVNQYYGEVYNYLVHNLNATQTCDLIGICPNGPKKPTLIAPLLPNETAQAAIKLMHTPEPRDDFVVKVVKPKEEQLQQLPIDLLVPPHNQLYNQQVCVFCEYFLHYVQKAITSPAVEADIKKVIETACKKLPNSVNATCEEFVTTYEPALVALLAQEIDPSQVCPFIKACPSSDVRDVDIFMQSPKSSTNCPLCLYAVTELEDLLKGKHTKEDIKQALGKVCSRLPDKLKSECNDFINTYTDELIEMLIANFKPQEVCVYLKLCDDKTPAPQIDSDEEDNLIGGDIDTNIIFDNTVNGEQLESEATDSECVLCEFIMKQIDDELKDKKTDDEIKKVVYDICKIMPGTVKVKCNNFVDEYADAIIILLQEAFSPSQICTMMKLCAQKDLLEPVKGEIFECAVCKATVSVIKKLLENPNVDKNIEHVLEKACRGIPKKMRGKCDSLIDEYGIQLVDMLLRDSEQICQKLDECRSEDYLPTLL